MERSARGDRRPRGGRWRRYALAVDGARRAAGSGWPQATAWKSWGRSFSTGAIIAGALPLLLIGTVLIGFGNASNQLSRYVAADLFPSDRRASALGIVVWGATIGAVMGPNLAAPAGVLAVALGLPELSGAYLVPVLFVGGAAVLTLLSLRPDPYALADVSSRHDQPGGDRSTSASLAAVLRRPNVTVQVVSLVTVQVVMVLVMTMTPLHMTGHGHDLAAVGVVISGHTLGMYALSPLSGRFTDKFGTIPVILVGMGVSAFAAVLAGPPRRTRN